MVEVLNLPRQEKHKEEKLKVEKLNQHQLDLT